MDVDEDALREGRVSARLYGFLNVPYERRLVQAQKTPNPSSEPVALEAIAQQVEELMDSVAARYLGSMS
jgi:predicted polyphosphate/ATP-dependent NAD kinase